MGCDNIVVFLVAVLRVFILNVSSAIVFHFVLLRKLDMCYVVIYIMWLETQLECYESYLLKQIIMPQAYSVDG